jgi:hypothetical protein
MTKDQLIFKFQKKNSIIELIKRLKFEICLPEAVEYLKKTIEIIESEVIFKYRIITTIYESNHSFRRRNYLKKSSQ